MVSIYYAQVPSQRWALPEDTDRDRYENEFDGWLNDNYDLATNTIYGVPGDEAWDSSELWDTFMDYRRSLRDE